MEVCRRADDVQHHPSSEKWQRQLAALEALQIFAPMGHALGLARMCAELEDQCFQVLYPVMVPEQATIKSWAGTPPDNLFGEQDDMSGAVLPLHV